MKKRIPQLAPEPGTVTPADVRRLVEGLRWNSLGYASETRREIEASRERKRKANEGGDP